ncbi:MAG: acyl--CoA ligase [Acidimicrobiia bacterium]|nr:acyl--CoA ligase [Acidimicrobiia bacterium]
MDVPEELARIEADLQAPGAPFETRTEDVLGEKMDVFATRAGSLRELVEASAGFGDAEYLVFSDGSATRRFTFAEHHQLVASTAAALAQRFGIGPGDRVAILGANSPEWIITFWATVSLGAVAVGLNGWWTGPEIRYGLEDADPTVLVADRKRLDRLGGDDPGVPTVVIEDDFTELSGYDPAAGLPDTAIDEDDPALILYTSGTTGRPKGAVNTHRNVIALLGMNFFHGLRILALNPPGPDSPPNCQLVTSPLFHVSGLHNAAIVFLAGGIKSVWTVGRFDPETVMRLIESERVTGWAFTPTMLRRVVEHPEAPRYDLSTLRGGGGGGSAFPPALQARTKELIPGLRSTMGVGYGLTECSALATLNTGEELTAHPESVGRPMPTVQIEIRDPVTGDVVPDGVDGEIHLRGPSVMIGYWQRPEETAEAIGPGRWLRTGDIGRMVDGRLYLASRKRDLILRGGENVYPVEIEQRLEEHPSVAEAAVVGVPDEDLGQAVHAVVVVSEGAALDAETLQTWVGESLAYYKVPATVEFRTDPLPRNATGKVLKQQLLDGGPATFVEE